MSAPLARRLPAERSAPPRDLEIRPKQVKAWIESLPLAQTMETAKKLVAHLVALNRAKIDTDDRVQILDIYRPFADTLLEELDAIYSKSALPLGPRAREALGAARELAFALADGFKIAIGDKTGKILAFGAKKQLPLLALRTMEYLGAELRASYKSYSPVPPAIWNEMHQLYLYAEKEGFATEVADPATKVTVMDAYCEALLLSLTDPYRLMAGEAERIIVQIRGARGLATLGQARPQTRPGGHFLVPCDTDRPPKPILSANDDAGGPNWRCLDTNPLVDKLKARKAAHDTGNVSQTTSRSMTPDGLVTLGKLITLWGDPPKRAYRRDPMETSVAICFGLKSIGHFISIGAKVDAEAEADAIRAGITIPLLAMPDDESTKQHPVFEWDVVNQSEGGLKVRRSAATGQTLGVGELVGIKAIGKPQWTIGVARWITVLEDGGMEFGLQFLAPAACAVWVNPVGSGSPQSKLGVLLANGEDAPSAESLLTPAGTYAEAREYELRGEDVVSRVSAAGLIEKTSRFELFHVSPS
jgi:hypothetical protein